MYVKDYIHIDIDNSALVCRIKMKYIQNKGYCKGGSKAHWGTTKVLYVIRVVYVCLYLHPVSLRRFLSFRTQPLENITPLSMNKWVPEQPSPFRKSSKRESCYGDRVYSIYDTYLQCKCTRAYRSAPRLARTSWWPSLTPSRSWKGISRAS